MITDQEILEDCYNNATGCSDHPNCVPWLLELEFKMKIMKHIWIVEFYNEYTKDWEMDGLYEHQSKGLLLTSFETRADARRYCKHQNSMNECSEIKVDYRYRKVEYV